MSFSPIIEQSPTDEAAPSQLAPPSHCFGTIVGEGLCSTSSTTMVQVPPPGVLSFRDQTICTTFSADLERPPKPQSPSPAEGEPFNIPEDVDGAEQDSLCDTSTSPDQVLQPGWSTSPEQAPQKDQALQPDWPMSPERVLQSEQAIQSDWSSSPEPAFQLEQAPQPDWPMSPERAPQPDWLDIQSPEVLPEADLDTFLSPCRLEMADVPMSPEPPLCKAVAMSPAIAPPMDATVSEDRDQSNTSLIRCTFTGSDKPPLVSNPWSDTFISQVLKGLTPPLSSNPNYITWSCDVPAISPRRTITMGNGSAHSDITPLLRL